MSLSLYTWNTVSQRCKAARFSALHYGAGATCRHCLVVLPVTDFFDLRFIKYFEKKSLLRIYHVASYCTVIKQQLKVNKVRNVLPALSAAGTQQLQPEPEQPPDIFTSPWEQRFLHLPWASAHFALILHSARKSRKWKKIKADVKDEALPRGYYFVACMCACVVCNTLTVLITCWLGDHQLLTLLVRACSSFCHVFVER